MKVHLQLLTRAEDLPGGICYEEDSACGAVVHYQIEDERPEAMNTDPRKVTCKRCLAWLAKHEIQAYLQHQISCFERAIKAARAGLREHSARLPEEVPK